MTLIAGYGPILRPACWWPAVQTWSRRRRPSRRPRRAYYVTPAIAVATLAVTLAWGSAYGMGLRDPDGIIGWRFSFVLMLVARLLGRST